jgi:hypothetical protein
MELLKRIRRIVFLILLLSVALAPTQQVSANGSCDGYDWCMYCDSGARCVVPLDQSCEQYTECRFYGICSGTTGPTLNICDCDPCPD